GWLSPSRPGRARHPPSPARPSGGGTTGFRFGRGSLPRPSPTGTNHLPSMATSGGNDGCFRAPALRPSSTTAFRPADVVGSFHHGLECGRESPAGRGAGLGRPTHAGK